MTVYFPVGYMDSPELRQGLVQTYQSLLRHRMNNPSITIEDVTRR